MSLLVRFVLPCLCVAACARAESVRVAAAISLKEAMTEIADAYHKDGRGDVKLTFGSSGQLQAQVEYGAPVDLFISASHKQVDELDKAGRVDGKARRVIARNRLVLIVPRDAKATPASFKDLADAKVRRVAVGQPNTVPAGQYAMQVLSALKIDAALRGKLVEGANVRQVLDYVERGEVDAGIVYATDAKEAGEAVRVVETADASLHDAIEYPAVVVRDASSAEAARRFLDYLWGEKARALLKRRGFAAGADDGKPAGRPARP